VLRTMAQSRSRVYHRAKGTVRRDVLLHARSRWLHNRGRPKQARLRLRLNGTTHKSICGDRIDCGGCGGWIVICHHGRRECPSTRSKSQ
jgi:hypothetical protein